MIERSKLSSRLSVLIVAASLGAVGYSPGATACDGDQSNDDLTVIVTTTGSMSRQDRYEIQQQGIALGEYLGENQYLGLVQGNQDLVALQAQLGFVLAITELNPTAKIDGSINLEAIPEYARVGDQILIQVSFFASSREEEESIVRSYSDVAEFDDETGTWVIETAPENIAKLAEQGKVRRIEIAEDPKLLEEDPFGQK